MIFCFLGNEARHFTLKEDTIANRNAATTVIPPTYEYVFVKGTNVSYVGEHFTLLKNSNS